MRELMLENRRKYFINALIEWVFWMLGSIALVFLIKWASVQYGATEYEFHVWISATIYLWYISSMSLVLGSTYFIARTAQTHLERRHDHPQKPHNVDLTNDLRRIKKIKKRAGIVAIVLHTLNACFVYYISRFIPGITPEFQLYAVIGVFAVAAIKPGFSAISAIRVEILGMVDEADYPVKNVADLWTVVDKFGNYEARLESIFKEIDKLKEEQNEFVETKLTEIDEALVAYREELRRTFQAKVTEYQESDSKRELAYKELKEAQMPIIKEISKILAAIQSLKDFVIELRDKNIKGEQLMSALKEFGIDSLGELNVTFQKAVVDRNPRLKEE